MFIRAKEQGRAVKYTGDNFAEVLDSLSIVDTMNRFFGTTDRESLLEAYRADAQANSGSVFIKHWSREESCRVLLGMYAVITNWGVFALTETDFNELYEEDTTI